MLLIAAVRNILRSVIRILGLAREDEGGALCTSVPAAVKSEERSAQREGWPL